MDQEKINEKIAAVVDKIIKEYQPEKIILFGSWAWGKPHEDSDVDLLIIKDTLRPRVDRERELRSLLFPPSLALDILVYTREEIEKSINENHNLFIEDIVRNGKTLYTNPGSGITVTLPERILTVLQ